MSYICNRYSYTTEHKLRGESPKNYDVFEAYMTGIGRISVSVGPVGSALQGRVVDALLRYVRRPISP
jgi:hypothetical protein